MNQIPRELAALCVDAFLLARYGPPGDGRPEGRAWERAASGLLLRPGLARRQHAGTLGLFGRDSASGARHELDGVGQGHRISVWLEAKARPVIKEDIATLHMKCLDLYTAAVAEDPSGVTAERWWPVIMSSEPSGEAARRLCAGWGVVLCDPATLPLVALFDAASQPVADIYVPEARLSELLRIGASAIAPMQTRWRANSEQRELRLTLERLTPRAIGDLLWLQDELTGDLLDAFDVHAPGYIAARGGALADRMEAAALAA